MRRLLLLVMVATLALAPAAAMARAGFGGSMGSRGGRTYFAPRATPTAPYAAPIGRSATPQYSQGYASRGYGYGQRRPGLGTGLAAGLIGGGLLGMMLGHGFGYGGGGLGGLLQIVLLGLLAWWLFRRFARRAGAGIPFGMRASPSVGAAYAGPPLDAAAPPLDRADYQAFEQLLQGIQSAWTAQDLRALQGMTTPEMAGYFAEQLAEQQSRGVRNSVTDVRLQRGDLSEGWREGGREYATVAMRFAMIDVTRDASGRVVDGSPGEHVEAAEFWTFLRAQGGRWILSAIQQAK